MDSLGLRNFLARGEVRQNDLTIPITISGSYSTDRSSPIQCVIAFDETSSSSDWYTPSLTPNDLEISGVTSEGIEILIPSFRIINSSHHVRAHERHTWNIEADTLLEGDLSKFQAPEGYIDISFLIPETPILSNHAVFLLDPDGSIKRNGEPPSRVQWSIPPYTFEASEYFGKVNPEKPVPNTTIQQRKHCINARFPVFGPLSLADAPKTVEKPIKDSLLLLSMLSRKRLDWHKAKVVFIPKTSSNERPRSAEITRYAWLGFDQGDRQRLSQLEMPVKHEAFRAGLFQNLITNYLASEYYRAIEQTVYSLLSSYESGYFEAHLSILYSGLEGLVDRASEVENIAFLLKSSDFKKLSKHIRQVIQDQLGDNDITNKVIGKLPELRRRSFFDKLVFLVEKNLMDIEKLGTDRSNLPQTVREIVNRRNDFIHQGKMVDDSLYHNDYHRIQVILELWILNLLGCPHDAINEREYRNHWLSS